MNVLLSIKTLFVVKVPREDIVLGVVLVSVVLIDHAK